MTAGKTALQAPSTIAGGHYTLRLLMYIAPTTAGWTSQEFGTNPGGFNPVGGHTGEDIALPLGSALVAMADGVVLHSGYFQGTYSDNPWWIEPSFAGFVVVIDYGAYVSLYAHLSASAVRVGQKVVQGQEVAYSGNTGSATSGPHLHWEVMPDGWDFQNGTYGRINPRSVLNTIEPQSTPTEEDDMFTEQDRAVINSANINADTARREATNAKLAASACLDAVVKLAKAGGADTGTVQEILDGLAKRLEN